MMKKHPLSIPFCTILVLSFVLSSCGGGDRDVFRIMPESTNLVVTFNPKMLMKKGRLQELDFIKKSAARGKLPGKILDDPASAGIKMSAYSAFFAFGKNPAFGGFVVPLDNEANFGAFVRETAQKDQSTSQIEELNGYQTLHFGNNGIVAWNHKVAFVISSFKGWAGDRIDTAALTLINTRRAGSILTYKDFNKFLARQRDINVWISSTNLTGLTGLKDAGKLMDIFGGLKNNYGHIFIAFEKGAMRVTSDLRLNPGMKNFVGKYNFLDRNAQKDLLKYLPQEDLFCVANLYVNPEKIVELLKFVNGRFLDQFEKIENQLGVQNNELKEAFQGEIAFSVNGIRKSPTLKESEIYGDSSWSGNVPVFVAAVRLQNEQTWALMKEAFTKEKSITEENGIYSWKKGIPLYLTENSHNIIITNSKPTASGIAGKGMIANNVLKAPYASVLTKDPLCFYVDLNAAEYPPEMKDYIQERMGTEINIGIESFGKTLRSLSVTANLQEWELTLELNDESENSLYAMLKNL